MADAITLDPTFGQGGIVEIAMPDLPSSDRVVRTRSHAQMADGRLVLLAQSSTTVALVRVMPNGTLDTSFGTQGQVVLTGDMTAEDVLVQPDGKILVLAKGTSATVQRLLVNGSLDMSFSGDGIYELPVTVSAVRRLCLQPDDKILVAAETYPAYSADWMIVRLGTDGTPDLGWGTAGVVTRDVQASLVDRIGGLAVQSDGRVVVAGVSQTSVGTTGDVVVMRFLTTGAVDTTFATSGRLVHSLGTREEDVFDLAVQPDDKLVVLASTYIIPPSRNQSCVLRLTAAGALDTTFDGDGRANVTLSAYGDYVAAVEVDAAGRVVVVGSQQDTFQSASRLAVVRLTAGGAPDTTFDGDGIAVLNPAKRLGYGAGLALQADGDWIITGQQSWMYDTPPPDVAAVRINDDGGLDSAYGADGVFSKDLQIYRQLARAEDVALQADGRLLLVGDAQGIGSSDRWLGVARLLPHGQLDSSYGSQGMLSLAPLKPATCVTLQPDGKALIGTATTLGSPSIAVLRLDTQGVPDIGFGVNGVAAYDLAVFGEGVREVQALADGKILVGGYAEPGFLLMRLLENGARDTAFGTNGEVVTRIGNVSSQAYGMATQVDGKIVLVGMTRLDNGNVSLALTRHSAEGVLDTTFSGDGIQTLAINGSHWTEGNDVVVLPDGKIVVAGTTSQGTYQVDTIVARYLANGTLDSSFGSGGIVRINSLLGDERTACVEVLANGDVVVAGMLADVLQSHWFLARIKPSGLLAAPLSLLPGPVQAATAWQRLPGGRDMLVDGAGNLVIAGGNQRNMVVMRFPGESGSLYHSYDLWRAINFTAAERQDALLTGATGDYDGDGLANAMEHVMGTPPKAANTLPPQQVGVLNHAGGRQVTLSIHCPASTPGNATLVIESSSSLAPGVTWTTFASRVDGQFWSPGGVFEVLQADGSRRATATFDHPLSATQVFYRLRVVSP